MPSGCHHLLGFCPDLGVDCAASGPRTVVLTARHVAPPGTWPGAGPEAPGAAAAGAYIFLCVCMCVTYVCEKIGRACAYAPGGGREQSMRPLRHMALAPATLSVFAGGILPLLQMRQQPRMCALLLKQVLCCSDVCSAAQTCALLLRRCWRSSGRLLLRMLAACV